MPSQPANAAQRFLLRPQLKQLQEERLRALLAEILPGNTFYARKFDEAGIAPSAIRTLDDLRLLPFTTKTELVEDQKNYPPYGQILTYPRERYCRLYQTSGTLGKPLRWLDTPQSWEWTIDCWKKIFEIAGVHLGDRLFFPFSFGPFLGFWTAFDAATRLGLLSIPGGGMSSVARLHSLLENQATVLLCTPTYALRLLEVASQEDIDLAGSPVRALIVAGEPGGSIPTTRQRLESGWGARVFDHAGMTEIGPCSIECPENPAGLHLLETDYIGEIIDPISSRPVAPGVVGELVLTNLGRAGSPLLRYRTGDVVRQDAEPCPCRRSLLRLEGGILGRTDDMIHVRGNNLYPSALEAVIRKFPEVVEYRVEIDQSAALAALRIEIEPSPAANRSVLVEQIGRAVRDELLFRAEVIAVEPGSLPRFEMKARRIHTKKDEG